MAKTKQAYPAEFRHKLIQLHRSGRSLSDLAQEFGVNRQTIFIWTKQEQIDTGERTDGLTTEERKELTLLRKRVRELEEEKLILKKAAAWFARESGGLPPKSSE